MKIYKVIYIYLQDIGNQDISNFRKTDLNNIIKVRHSNKRNKI